MAAVAVGVMLPCACSTTSSVAQTDPSITALATRGGEMDALTAAGLVDALGRAGLPVPNPVNTTAQECPAAGCLQSIVTDTVRIKSFARTGQAQSYAGDRGLFQVMTIVISFAPPITPEEQDRYRIAVQRLAE